LTFDSDRDIISTSNDLIWKYSMPTHYKGSPEQELALDTYIKFTRASDSVESRLMRRAVLEDLTTTQFGVMESLLHLGPMCQSELGGKLLKSGGNITLVVDNLEKHGLVRRQTRPDDRRMTDVSLTPAGEELIKRIFPDQVKIIVEEFGALSSEEQKLLGQLCKKLGKKE
jgi:MarR family 2-MHQ and catechol resistance regulon transcriptional repressor